MTAYTSWSKRTKHEGKLSTDLLRGEERTKVGTFVDSTDKAFTATAMVDEQQWEISFDINGSASATLPDGRVFTANAGEKNFKKSQRIEIDMDGVGMVAINENKNNWIIDDANSDKVAQFTGANNGVRDAVLEFEEGVTVSPEHEAFLSWVARKTLESRLVGSSWGLTLFLVILTPIIIFLTVN